MTGIATVVGAVASAVVVTAGTPSIQFADPDNGVCPDGYLLVDRAELIAEHTFATGGSESNNVDPSRMLDPTCMIDNLPESFSERMAMAAADDASAPAPGSYAGAYEQAEALSTATAQAKVPNIAGLWQPYGTGLLIGDDERYTETRQQGLTDLAGRIDSLVLDEESGRIFAAGGTSGVWMSDDLAETWTSIGDNLPSPANGAIAWTSEGGGTLVAVSGEPTFGGNLYAGNGAFWTNDLGATWNKAAGVPEGALGFAVEVDPASPSIVYVGTSLGLFRSDDAGRTFTNVALPTSDECAGVNQLGTVCDTANVVTDVIVMKPGGATNEAGGQVLAAVGHRNEARTYPTGETRSPGQGLYFSDTGEVGSFEHLGLLSTDLTNIGFASQERQGRVEFGQATGDAQDHNIIYAIVSDPAAMAGATPAIDLPEGPDQQVPDPRDIVSDAECNAFGLCVGVAPNSALNGLYASTDFGQTWIRMADDVEIADNPATGSALYPVRALIAPGVQAWYNQWIEPDPTVTDPITGAPARLLFGLEEIWSGVSQVGVPFNGPAQLGPSDFEVVGRYFGGQRCAFLDNPVPTPACPTARPITTDYTTHPDQHDALWIPKDDGGVVLLTANDGGVYKADLAAGERIDNNSWETANTGMNTLLPYSVAVSEDGTVYLGLQDNGTAKIDPETGEYAMVYVGDGTYATVDPFDGNISVAATPGGGFASSTNGGESFDTGRGTAGDDAFQFVTPWKLDPIDETHLITAGNKVHVSSTGLPGGFSESFDLGESKEQPGIINLGTAMAARGDAEYVAYCGVCDVYRNAGFRFFSGIATNVGDDDYEVGSATGWHHATAEGLPERYVTDLWVDAADDATLYATLGGYAGRRWAGIDTFTDPDRGVNSQGGLVYKSSDAGETFVDISGDLPQTRANWVIQRGEQLLVATDVGVFLSSDMNGTSWAKLAGMPNHPVKQIQLQPEHEDVLFAALYGRSIWTYTFGTEVAPVTPIAPAPDPVDVPATPVTGGGAAALGVALLGGGWALRRRSTRGLIG